MHTEEELSVQEVLTIHTAHKALRNEVAVAEHESSLNNINLCTMSQQITNSSSQLRVR